MSDLKAFLKPSVSVITHKIVVSTRFTDDHGKPVPFEIHSISQAENDALRKASTKTKTDKGQRVEIFDAGQYQARLVVACTAAPDFRSPEMLKAYGAADPLDVPGKMLLAGEFVNLGAAILEICGFNEETPEALKEEAKN
ncbi:MAG: phage portal protein [Negativicutes bacterium]|nr:phage portal protein [Negativicutes bacterium]